MGTSGERQKRGIRGVTDSIFVRPRDILRTKKLAPSQLGVYPPPGYQSGRNTPQSPFHPMAETTPLQTSSSQPISDADLERAVQDVLRSAYLNSITKREICHHLESHFGMDPTSRKAVINAAIDHFWIKSNAPLFHFFLLPYLNTLHFHFFICRYYGILKDTYTT